MLNELMNIIRRIFGMDHSWEMLTFPRVQIDPASARSLTQVLQPAHTIRLRPDPMESGPLAATPRLTWHGITDTGMVRPHNEDDLAHLKVNGNSLFVVADGMGGHDAGEVASSVAVRTVSSEIRRIAVLSRDPLGAVERAIQAANAVVHQEAVRKGSNMGTTLAVALVIDGVAHIGNVGDSRIYWIENGSITQLTEDHSLVAKLVSAGKLTKEEARTDPRSNLLYRTIGIDGAVRTATTRWELKTGGTLLLCTDGLWNEVSDEEIYRICAEEKQTELICARLVQLANANGGRDNITAIAVKVL
ncbi:MAG: Stp1/IreP family PP2C-type Ser/Thr phosphatase [Nitrospirota bacterium]|nr:Stp1/IreP family PP2C-type Ser/Thr phosphatase [Nitrospirota bacterium]